MSSNTMNKRENELHYPEEAYSAGGLHANSN